ncbi:hypothetical protein BJX96DRAFT_165901 [Aspergillus floccosus]
MTDIKPTAFLPRPLKVVVIGAGCTCDVPSHTYQFSWNSNPKWSKLYAPASEIQQYLESTVEKHDLRRYIWLNWNCVSAQWEERTAHWTTVFEHTQSKEAQVVVSDVLIYAVGRLNNYRLPEVEGMRNFQGDIVHTACWPASLDVREKTVVVVGNGASAVHPGTYYGHRKSLEQKLAGGFRGLWKGTFAQAQFTAQARSFMESNIHDPALRDALIPDFEAGCRRFTPGAHYLRALQESNITYVRDKVVRLTQNSVITQTGKAYPCDIIVFATGFEPYRPRFPVMGRDGCSLEECWHPKGPCESYMASMVAGFPNFFASNPPICPVNGSAVPGIERAANYMVRVISRLQTDNLQSVCVKFEAQKRFNEWAQSRMPAMVWSGSCNSWYKNRDGKVIVPWPGTVLHYYAATRIGHEYESFGNGITQDGFVPDEFPWVAQGTSTVGIVSWQALTANIRAMYCSVQRWLGGFLSRNRGSGIAPFLPIPSPSQGLWLPVNICLFCFRLPILVFLCVGYFLLIQWFPLGFYFKKACLALILGTSTIIWNDLQVDGVRKGSLSKQRHDTMPGPGDVIASSFTSPIDAIYLAFIFDPIFTASYPNSRQVEHISLLQAILRAFSAPQMNPPQGAQLVDLATLIRKYPRRTIVTFPECTTTNARGILPLSPCLLSAPPNTRIFPVSLRYTPVDIVTPLPGSYLSFAWALMSNWCHWMRIRVAEAVVTGRNGADAPAKPARRSTYDTNLLDILDSDQADGSSSETGASTPREKALLNQVADSLARLGRVKRVGLGVPEKKDFVRMWTRTRRTW